MCRESHGGELLRVAQLTIAAVRASTTTGQTAHFNSSMPKEFVIQLAQVATPASHAGIEFSPVYREIQLLLCVSIVIC